MGSYARAAECGRDQYRFSRSSCRSASTPAAWPTLAGRAGARRILGGRTRRLGGDHTSGDHVPRPAVTAISVDRVSGRIGSLIIEWRNVVGATAGTCWPDADTRVSGAGPRVPRVGPQWLCHATGVPGLGARTLPRAGAVLAVRPLLASAAFKSASRRRSTCPILGARSVRAAHSVGVARCPPARVALRDLCAHRWSPTGIAPRLADDRPSRHVSRGRADPGRTVTTPGGTTAARTSMERAVARTARPGHVCLRTAAVATAVVGCPIDGVAATARDIVGTRPGVRLPVVPAVSDYSVVV